MRPSSQPKRRLRVPRTARAVTGGCKVLENPDRRGDEAVLFWQSELLADLVRLVVAPVNTNSQLRFDPLHWAGQLAALATDEGLHLILRLPDATEYRLLLPGPDPPRDGSPLTIVIEPNAFWRFRVAAAERFLALAARSRLPMRPRLSALVPPEEVVRRTYMLWAIDLQQVGASEHEIGAMVFGTRVSSAIWSNHADRSELRRLLRAGRGFVSGRYRELLQHTVCAKRAVGPWSVSANPSSTIPSPLDRADVDRQRESRAFAASRERWSTSMPDPLAGLPPRHLRTPEAARWLGISGRTLEKHRIYGTGPVYRKIGGRVVYRVDDLERWVDKGRRTSTSDPGSDTVLPPKRTAG